MKRRLLFQKWDEKSRMWSGELQKLGVDADGVRGSAIRAPWVLLKSALKGRRYDAYVFRYLSDYPGFLRTVSRTVSEFLVVVLSRILGVRILWILHNVDRESNENWPAIARLRRALISSSCHMAFVTDPLLLSAAIERYPKTTWAVATFGTEVTRSSDPAIVERVVRAARLLRQELRDSGARDTSIGLCFTSMSPKCLHLRLFRRLLETGRHQSFRIGVVFVGDFSVAEEWRRIGNEIEQEPNAHVIDCTGCLQESDVEEEFGFFYRSLDDLSVPYSLYRAASVGKPVITHDAGFCARIASEYKVGAIIEDISSEGIAQFLSDWSSDRWSTFLKERSWSNGAKALADAVFSPCQ